MLKCVLLAGLCVLIMAVLGRLAASILLSKRSSWKKMWVPLLLLVIIVAAGFALTSIFFYTVSHDNFLTRGDALGTGQKSKTKLYYAPAVNAEDAVPAYDIYLKESE